MSITQNTMLTKQSFIKEKEQKVPGTAKTLSHGVMVLYIILKCGPAYRSD